MVDSFGLSAPKTKSALAVLTALDADGRVLVVLSRDDEATARSLANLPNVVTLPGDQLTAFDVLCADVIVFTDETLPGGGSDTSTVAVLDAPVDFEPVVDEPMPVAPAPVAAVPVAAEPVAVEIDASASDVAVSDAAVADEIEKEGDSE